MAKIIIGITGTLGAGKGTVVEYLKTKGFNHYSVRNYLIAEIENKDMPVNRDSMVAVANELRAKNSHSFIIDELYKQAVKDEFSKCIIESIRTPGEIESLQTKANFYLLAVDAPAKIRYDRIAERKSATDMVSFKQFVADEAREMTSADLNKQNLSQCISLADFKIDNSGTIKNLHAQVDKILDSIK